jgi:hypothetical protein
MYTNIAMEIQITPMALNNKLLRVYYCFALVAAFLGCNSEGNPSAPVVSQSVTPIDPDNIPKAILKKSSLPSSAHDGYFAISGVGLGGRFLAFRFSANRADVQSFPQAFYRSHDQLKNFQRIEDVEFAEYIPDEAFIIENYGADISWLAPFRSNSGTVTLPPKDSGAPVLLLDLSEGRVAGIWMD